MCGNFLGSVFLDVFCLPEYESGARFPKKNLVLVLAKLSILAIWHCSSLLPTVINQVIPSILYLNVAFTTIPHRTSRFLLCYCLNVTVLHQSQ